jgi:hypothetical protein
MRITQQEVVVEHEVQRIVPLGQLVFSSAVDGALYLHHFVFQKRQFGEELRRVDQNRELRAGVLHAHLIYGEVIMKTH